MTDHTGNTPERPLRAVPDPDTHPERSPLYVQYADLDRILREFGVELTSGQRAGIAGSLRAAGYRKLEGPMLDLQDGLDEFERKLAEWADR